MAMIRAVVLVLATAGILATMHGPSSATGPEGGAAALLDCFATVERDAGLLDGVGSVSFARFVNAARFARPSSDRIVVDMAYWDPPSVQPTANNLAWFDDGYRHGEHRLNFLATHRYTEAGLAYFRSRVGHPDRIYHCPSIIDDRGTSQEGLDLWVYDGAEAQARLAALVAHDPLANGFVPRRRGRSFRYDPPWAMYSPNDEAKLVGAELLWQRAELEGDRVVDIAKPMFLASGRYRLRVEADVVNHGPVAAQVRVWLSGKELARVDVDPSRTSTTIELDVKSRGGPTAGDNFAFAISTGDATEVRMYGAELELVEKAGVDLFRLFR